ncbi:MAG: hypothetical protein K8R90_03895 [Candidatus Cloacimonetes bacterium]|nr:hypothetical protein [Candidatus Cloacimonadota bacterium]
MPRKWMFFLLLFALMLPLAAQVAEEPADEEYPEDFVRVNYEKKSVATAVLLSTLFPGAGQFYANYRSVTTYIFPVIEIGLWVGFITFNNKGSDMEDEYMAFADGNYNRVNQTNVQNKMIGVIPAPAPGDNNPDNRDDIYDTNHFRLDPTNTQHFYEDIGKYDKYIFGWTDWYEKYAYTGIDSIDWVWDTSEDDPDHKWVGNFPTHPNFADQGDYDTTSALRGEYISMRQDAEDFYGTADLFTFGIVFNHILSAIDAVRVTRAYNIDYISKRPPVEVDVQTCMRSGGLTPMLTLTRHF